MFLLYWVGTLSNPPNSEPPQFLFPPFEDLSLQFWIFVFFFFSLPFSICIVLSRFRFVKKSTISMVNSAFHKWWYHIFKHNFFLIKCGPTKSVSGITLAIPFYGHLLRGHARVFIFGLKNNPTIWMEGNKLAKKREWIFFWMRKIVCLIFFPVWIVEPLGFLKCFTEHFHNFIFRLIIYLVSTSHFFF